MPSKISDTPRQKQARLQTEVITTSEPRRIFISYGAESQPDSRLAETILNTLRSSHQVFMEQPGHAPISTARLAQELEGADFMIILLSGQSASSELLTAQVARAVRLAHEQAGLPALLCVRVQYKDLLPYPLSVYTNKVEWARWESESDTPRLLAHIQRALAGKALPEDFEPAETSQTTHALATFSSPAFSAPLELPEGTMRASSPYYITRNSDRIALETIRATGVTITIKGPRQMGKSSLLVRVADEARQVGKQVALLDFQFFDSEALQNFELFLRQFCAWLSYTLKIEDRSAHYWNLPLGNIQRCTFYLEDYVMPQMDGPLVLALDEVDKIFDTAFRSDFFGMLRGWHNRRYAASDWQRLDLVLVTSTEPYQLVANLNQSPFNVGQVIELEDFTPAQVHELNGRHGQPFRLDDEKRLLKLLGGQPYLVRRALYLVASQRLGVAELFDTASHERGPFGDHLRYHLFRMHRNPTLVKGLWQVLQHRTLADEDAFFRLQGAGLIRREGRSVVPRCQLYADYFREHLAPLLEQIKAIPPGAGTAGGQGGLSGRELEVLRLVMTGLTNSQIGQQLSITPGTVNVHLNAIYSKLGVTSRTAAIRYALDHKLI